MEHFNRFYTQEVLEGILRRIPDDRRDKDVAYFLTHQGEGAQIRREALDKYLELGFRHDVLDADLTSRLRSPDWDQFIQARNELLSAWYFESVLQKNLRFRPQGNGQSVGEFEVVVPENPAIFVEVKSPWQQPPPNSAWSGHDGPQIRQNVDRARRQLPNDRPTLVIVSGNLPGGLSDPFSGMVQALYGEPVIHVPVGGDAQNLQPRDGLIPSGLFQPTANTRISAVATLEELVGSPYLDSILRHILSGNQAPINTEAPMNVLKYSFKIYHNRYARNPIAPEVFEGSPQLLLSEDQTQMEWRLT